MHSEDFTLIENFKSLMRQAIFHLFDSYMSELLTNYKTDHSHQWTDIEFNRLKETFDSSAFAFENH